MLACLECPRLIIFFQVALGLAMLTPINSAFGFGLFLSGCCPGGGASNVWTSLLGGDLNLSLLMTLFSSLAALGENFPNFKDRWGVDFWLARVRRLM